LKEGKASTLKTLRVLGFVEGISLLALLFIGMPLKYLLNSPTFTLIVGYIHGFLFIAYVIYCFKGQVEYGWKFFWFTFLLGLASFIPFGTFYTDKKMLSQIKPQP